MVIDRTIVNRERLLNRISSLRAAAARSSRGFGRVRGHLASRKAMLSGRTSQIKALHPAACL